MPEYCNWWQLAAMVAFTALNFSQILWKVVLEQSVYLPMLAVAIACMVLGWFMRDMSLKREKAITLAKHEKALRDRTNDSLRHEHERQRQESLRQESLRQESLRLEALPSLRNEASCRHNERPHNLRDGPGKEAHSRLSANRESGPRRLGPRHYEADKLAQTLGRRYTTGIPKHRTTLWRSLRAKIDAHTVSSHEHMYDQNMKEVIRCRSDTGRHAFALENSFGEIFDDESLADDSDMLSEVSSGCAFTDIGFVTSAGVCLQGHQQGSANTMMNVEPAVHGQNMERYAQPIASMSLTADRIASHLATYRHVSE